MGAVRVSIELANNLDVVPAKALGLGSESVRRLCVSAVVDPRRTWLVLPATVADHLGLQREESFLVHLDNGQAVTRTRVINVCLRLLGREGIYRAVVDPDRDDAVVGAIVLQDLDLLIDEATQTLRPRDPDTIITEIECVHA